MNNDLDFKKIGSRIQFYRTQSKMTQAELAEIIGTNQKHLSRLEAGYHRSSLDAIVSISKALNISVDALIADYDDSTDESTLKLIMDEVRGMSATQLEMLRDNIKIIKKYEK